MLFRSLWDADPVTFEGRYYSVKDAYFAPKPLQKPHPPLWVAGNSEAALKRAARFADAWHPVRPTPEFFTRSIADLARRVEEYGRPQGSVKVALKCPMTFLDSPPGEGRFPTQGRPGDIVEAIHRYEEMGTDYFVFDLVPETIDMAMETMEKFAREVRPKL